MKKIALVLALLTLGCSFSYAESMQSMDKNQVTNALSDKTITTIPLATLHDALVPNALSIYFGKDGNVLAQFADKPSNDPQNDQGSWLVKGNGQLCVSWKAWTNNKPTCVYTYKLADSLVFINTDGKFESMVMSDKIQAGNQVHS